MSTIYETMNATKTIKLNRGEVLTSKTLFSLSLSEINSCLIKVATR